MKRNLVLLAGVTLAAAGCAHQGGYARYEQGSASDMTTGMSNYSDPAFRGEGTFDRDATGRLVAPRPYNPPTVLEHDPDYSMAYSSTVSPQTDDSDMADRNAEREIRKQLRSEGRMTDHIMADSSKRGGSVQSRGWDFSGNEDEPVTNPMDPRVRADSSLRGGSKEARGRGWSYGITNPMEPSYGTSQHPFKADSSIRGGSSYSRGVAEYTGPAPEPSSDSEIAILDDTSFREPFQAEIIGDSGVANSKLTSEDPTLAQSSSEISVQEFTDSSLRLDETGAYGRPAAAETGSGSSESLEADSNSSKGEAHAPLSPSDPNWQFKLNPAQGLAGLSNPAGERTFGGSGSATVSDDQLAQRVKAAFAKENTGTSGLMSKEAARNISVRCENGKVILRGSVPSEQDKKNIGVRAGEVEGVKSVDNQLTVSSNSLPENRDAISGSHDLEERHEQLQH